MPFADNQNLIISRGVARIFSEVRKSIYYLRLSFTKKWFFLWPFGHCFDRQSHPTMTESLSTSIYCEYRLRWRQRVHALFHPAGYFRPFFPKYIIQDFRATNESYRFSGKRQLGVWKIYISKKGTYVRTVSIGGYSPDNLYNLSRRKAPDWRGWLGRVGGVTDVGRK